MIIIDESFWNKPEWLHEIIHTFIRYVPKKSAPSYYFFVESMVEYLTVYFWNKDAAKRDLIFQDKKQYFESLQYDKDVNNSILNLSDNFVNLNGGTGSTSPIIYERTPYLIHMLALTIDEEIFMRLLKNFYNNLNDATECTLDNLGDYLIGSGHLDRADWESFISIL